MLLAWLYVTVPPPEEPWWLLEYSIEVLVLVSPSARGTYYIYLPTYISLLKCQVYYSQV
jgi:hypothetical protein